MSWKDEWKSLAIILAGFLACFYLPVGTERFMEAFHLVIGLSTFAGMLFGAMDF